MKKLPVSHKPIETTQFFVIVATHTICAATHTICADPGATDDRGLREVTWGQMRLNEATIHFSSIGRDRMEIETRRWCNTARRDATEDVPIDLLGSRSVCTLTWPWPDLRLNFQIDLSTSKSTFFEPAQRGEHDGVISIFVSPISKSY